jgi:hypothetical protein
MTERDADADEQLATTAAADTPKQSFVTLTAGLLVWLVLFAARRIAS